MYTLWKIFDPRQALIGLHVFLFALAFVIHFVLLSTDRYNWLAQPNSASTPQQNSALPQ